MAANFEKRLYERSNLKTSIMYSYEDKKFCFYGAQVCNCSMGGVYIESQYPLEKGMQITIRRANDNPATQGEAAYMELMAEVKWCKEIPLPETSHYGAGIQYFIPISELPF